jgi:hypothetical protein
MQTNLALAETVEFIRCPRCERPELTAKDFGICRARTTGRNLYCKLCIVQKIAKQRQNLREYKAAHQGNAAPVTTKKQIDLNFSPRRKARLLRKLSPVDRVLEAIRCGAKTQSEIRFATRLPVDEVCDVLARLLLWSRDIRTEVINGGRMYFVADATQTIRRQPVRPRELPSHGVSTIYSEGESAVWKAA